MKKILILAAGLAILSGCTRDASFPGEGENPQASKAAASVVTYSITGRISFSQGWKVEDVVLPTGQTGFYKCRRRSSTLRPPSIL